MGVTPGTFNWSIEHRPGIRHQNADYLSRMPCPGTCSTCIKIRNQTDMDEVIGTMLVHCRVIAVADTLPVRHRRHKRHAEDLRLVQSLEQKWDREELGAETGRDPILLMWQARLNWAEVSPLCLELKYYENYPVAAPRRWNGGTPKSNHWHDVMLIRG